MVEDIVSFWFGAEADDAAVAQNKAALWWAKSADTDEEIQARFADLVEKAAGGELKEWEASPRGRLALILLTDQFPRCIYRDSPKAFAHDHHALRWSLEGIDDGFERALRPIERVFFYLPLEHSERLENQDRSVDLFRQLLDGALPSQKKVFEEFLDFAVRHREIILRFGRFPHRNRVLGRASTPAELAFLSEPGSSF
jgi:uncharacterized protein (DUF924 family)